MFDGRPPIEVEFDQSPSDFGTRRRIRLHGTRQPERLARDGIWFDFDQELPEPLVLDGFLFALLNLAMTRGQGLRLHGPISETALANAQAWQEAWHCWTPQTHHMVPIAAEALLSDHQIAAAAGPGWFERGTVGMFSGGADASFLALRHAHKPAPMYDLQAVITVQGFDIAPDDDRAMAGLVTRSAPLLAELNLPRLVVRSNIRAPEFAQERRLQDWGQSHSTVLACVLHQLSHRFRRGLIGGNEPVNHLLNAWGSNPITDPLLSGAAMAVVHEGAGFDRSAKIALLNRHPVARAALKVCWQGADPARNCGQCAKCLRTRLNFLLLGETHPPCFDTPFDLAALAGPIAGSRVELHELVQILRHAQDRGLDAPWVTVLARRLSELGAEMAQHGKLRKKRSLAQRWAKLRRAFRR